MIRFVYFDTDAFRHIVKAFALDHLCVELRDKIVLSPITVLETLSQLTLPRQAGDEILAIMRSLPNCVNCRSIRMLPWWTAAVCGQVEEADDGLAKDIQAILNTCLNANTTAEVQGGTSALKDLLDVEREKQNEF
jgi:hypothetical protein